MTILKNNLEDDQQVDLEKFPFFLPELEKTEVEILLRRNPNAAKAFVDRCAKGEIDWEAFTPAERGIITNTIVEATISGTNELQAIKALREADWFRTPATPEEFVNDPKYLGQEMSTRIYAPWRKDLIFVLDPKNEIHEWVCFTGDTEIPLLDGTTKTLEQLSKENSEEFWVYSCTEEGNIVPGRAHSARLISQSASVLKVTLDNGEEIKCTPDHKFMLRDGSYKEAKDLRPNESLMPLYTTYEKVEKWDRIPSGYERVFNPATNEYLPTHRVVSHYVNGTNIKGTIGEGKKTIHHTSFNKLNNDPRYLQVIDRKEHMALHSEVGKSNWTKKEIREKLLRHLRSEKMRSISSKRWKGIPKSNSQIEKLRTATKGKPQPQFDLWRSSEEGKAHARSVSPLGLEAARDVAAVELRNKRAKESWSNTERRKKAAERLALRNTNGLATFASLKSKEKKQKEAFERYEKICSLLAMGKTPHDCVSEIGIGYTSILRLLARYGYPAFYKKNHKVFSIESISEKQDVYCLTVDNYHNFALKSGVFVHNCSGGIGVGKTRVAIIAQLYKLHVLTCLRNIQAYFTLDSATKISFGLFSLSIDKAEGAISDDFKTIINESPYFKNVFPIKKSRKIRKAMNNAASGNMRDMTDYEIILPQGLQILVGSKVSHALSYAVVSAILDEMNFRGKRTIKSGEDENSAENLYKQVRYRITSRFERLSYTPGLLCVISSRKTSSDFLEARIAALDGQLSNRTGSWVARQDRHAFISSYSQWDVKPDNFFDMNRKTFKVFIGSSARSSRILTEEDEKDFPEGSPNILEVPESTRRHFEHDVNAALRELAGISSSPTSLLFDDPTLLKNLWDRERYAPFLEDQIEIGLRTNRSISSYLLQNNFFFDAGFAVIPKYHPDMLRTIHVDLSKSGDSTGIAMGGVAYIKQNVGSNVLGNKIISSYSPEFFIDFALAIKAPQGDQIDYEKIQQFFSYLRRMKFKIHLITFDQAFSTGPMQMLIKDSFTVDNLSVDRTDIPYVLFRDAVHKNNVKCPFNKILEMELLNLIHDYSGAKAKVDHPVRNFTGGAGSKDISDAVTGVIANSYSMLTDTKKHPNTANLDIASKVINSLYKQDDLHNYFASEHEEAKLLSEHIDKLNPFSIKP